MRQSGCTLLALKSFSSEGSKSILKNHKAGLYFGPNSCFSVDERGRGRRRWLSQGHMDHWWCGWEKNRGLYLCGSVFLLSCHFLQRDQDSARNVLDLPQSHYEPSLCPSGLSHSKCLPCTSELWSRLASPCLTIWRCLFCSLWLPHGLAVAAAATENLLWTECI